MTKEEKRLKNKKYYSENKERIKEQLKQWARNNKGVKNACNRRWEKNNSEQNKTIHAKWYEKNKERIKKKRALMKNEMKAWQENRRAKTKYSGGKLSRGLVNKLLELQQGRCIVCRKDLPEQFHLDHIMPLALDGRHEDSNMQLLCPKCNRSKHAKHPIDFMQERGFLL